eukprot:359839-Chlamydomonas_euryale.AAC.5
MVASACGKRSWLPLTTGRDNQEHAGKLIEWIECILSLAEICKIKVRKAGHGSAWHHCMYKVSWAAPCTRPMNQLAFVGRLRIHVHGEDDRLSRLRTKGKRFGRARLAAEHTPSRQELLPAAPGTCPRGVGRNQRTHHFVDTSPQTILDVPYGPVRPQQCAELASLQPKNLTDSRRACDACYRSVHVPATLVVWQRYVTRAKHAEPTRGRVLP